MEKHQFKTNIKCHGCINTVAPYLNSLEGVQNWEVDINNPDKILTVIVKENLERQVKKTVEKAGFTAETF